MLLEISVIRPTLIVSLVNTLNANSTKWSNTPKQFVGKLVANCLSVFDHFVGLALKELSQVNTFHTKDCHFSPF